MAGDPRSRRWGRAREWARSPIGRGVLVGIGLVWGVALAAMTVLPFVQELTNSGYLARRIFDSSSHLPNAQIFSLVDLEAGGPPAVGPLWADVNPVEGASLVGLIVLTGAVASFVISGFGRLRVRTRDAVATWNFFCVLTPVLMVALFIGTPILGLFYKMPGLGQGPMHRARYVIAFGFAVVAAMGFDSIVGHVRSAAADLDAARVRVVSRWIGPLSLVACAGALIYCWPSFWALVQSDQFMAADMGGIVGRSVLLGLGLAAVAVVATLVGWRWPRLVPVTVVVVAALLFMQLAYPLRKFTPQVPLASFYPDTESHRVLQNLTDRGDRFRFAASELNFYPNSAMIYDLSDLRGLTVAGTQFREMVLAADPEAFTRDPLKLILFRWEWNLTSPVYDELSLGYLALGENEVPYGDVREIDQGWTRWLPATTVTSRPVPPPEAEIAGLAMPLRFAGPECSHGRAVLDVTDQAGHRAGAWRPITDLRASWTTFAVVGRDLDGGSPLTASVRFEGPGDCDIEVGSISDTGDRVTGTDADASDAELRPAVQWYVDDPNDGVRLVSAAGAWIYERPSALPLLSVHDAWQVVPDRASAIKDIQARKPGDPYRALIEGQPPEWVRDADSGHAEITDSRVDEDEIAMTVAAEGTTLVAIRDNFSPDWQATVDGEAVAPLKLNGTQLALFVPRGRHDVRLVYRPQNFLKGFIVSALAALLLVLVAGWTVIAGRRRRRRAPGSGGSEDSGDSGGSDDAGGSGTSISVPDSRAESLVAAE